MLTHRLGNAPNLGMPQEVASDAGDRQQTRSDAQRVDHEGALRQWCSGFARRSGTSSTSSKKREHLCTVLSSIRRPHPELMQEARAELAVGLVHTKPLQMLQLRPINTPTARRFALNVSAWVAMPTGLAGVSPAVQAPDVRNAALLMQLAAPS